MSAFTTAFVDHEILARGPAGTVESAVRARLTATPQARILIFDDVSGMVRDLGPPKDAHAPPSQAPTPPPGRGRPKLGVTAREVTLLPRHWDWLSTQRGGASAALRRLVEAAAKEPVDGRLARQEAAYRFMTALAGDLPAYEEAVRALFRDEAARFVALTAAWPPDVSAFARALAFAEER